MPQDFIPDGQFTPDQGTTAPSSASSPGSSDFIPDSAFVSDKDKYGTTGQQVITGLEGTARGMTLGGSDLIETGLLGVDPKDIKAREKENPWTSNLSQIGGGAALIGLTGGIAAPVEEVTLGSEAAEAGVAAARQALAGGATEEAATEIARMAAQAQAGLLRSGMARAIGFGTEGALFGAGNAVSDKALGDPNLTAQKVLADVGMGAALGSGLGLLSKATEIAFPKVVEKLGNALGSLKESVLGTAEEPSLAVRAASIPGGLTSGQSSQNWAQSFYEGLNKPDADFTVKEFTKNVQDIFDSSKSAANDLFEEATKPAEGAAETTESSNVLKQKWGKFAPEPSSSPSIPPASPAAENSNLFARWGKFAPKVAETTPVVSEGLAARPNGEMLQGLIDGHESALNNFQSSFMKGDTVDASKVEKFFDKFNDASQDPKKEALNDFINQTQAVADASKNYFSFKDAEGSISDKVSKLAEKNKELSEVAQALKDHVTGQASPDLNRFKRIAEGFAAHSLGVPNPIVGATLGTIEAYKAIANPYELGSNLAASFDKLQAIGDISNAVGKKIATLSKGILSTTTAARSVPLSALALASSNDYDKRVNRIEELAADPKLFMDHLSKNTEALYGAAPNVSQSIHQTMINGLQFLQSKIPRPSQELPLSSDWEPSRIQKAKFDRYYRAVNDPIAVLKDVKDGTFSNESLEALQAVHPHLLDEMRNNIVSNLKPEKAKLLPQGIKIALAKFLGQPLDSQMLPGSVLSNQLALNAPEQSKEGAPRQGRKNPTLGGLKQLNLAQRSATRTQDLESEND